MTFNTDAPTSHSAAKPDHSASERVAGSSKNRYVPNAATTSGGTLDTASTNDLLVKTRFFGVPGM